MTDFPIDRRGYPREEWLSFAVVLLLAPVLLYGTYRWNPVLSHELVEIFCIVVACGIFMLTWNARDFLDNPYFLFIGSAYLFVGTMDYLHELLFDELLAPSKYSDSIEFWFAARIVQVAAYLAGPPSMTRQVRPMTVLCGFAVASAALIGMAFGGFFPTYYIPGKGLTAAKSASEFAVVAMLVLAVALHWRVRERFDPRVFRLLILSILFSAATDASALVYTDAFVYNSVVGHYLKFVSYYLVYKAVIATALIQPYRLLFRNLQISASEIRTARDTLGVQVAARTADLRTANLRLEEELGERRRAASMRELMLDLHLLTQSADNVRDLLSVLSRFLQARFGFEAVGIRYQREADFPYFATRGFPSEFVQEEFGLCSRESDGPDGKGAGGEPVFECTCGAVIGKRFDPALPFFTPNGTFWTNGASDLLAASDAYRSLATRGRCVRQGYESILLVPLRLGEKPLGLIQFNDRRKGMIEPHLLDQIERVAENLSGVLARLLAQEALRESEDRFRSLVENSSAAILIYQRGRVIYGNPRLERIFGKVSGDKLFRELGIVHPEDILSFRSLCDDMDRPVPGPQDVDIRFLPADGKGENGEVRWIRCQATPISFRERASLLVELTDITRVKELEHIVAVREKLASLGQLSAGIAHEIRNPLSGININVSTLGLLCQRAEGLGQEEREKIRQVVAQAKAASEKISMVIRRVMDFSRPMPPKRDVIDMNGVVRGALALSEASVRRSGVELREKLPPGPLYCDADPSLMEQVLVNLVTNALQAMETSDRPARLTVSAAREGNRAVLLVSDTGPGVPPHLREKIFEPFYTTRKEGHGIGLSFSHRIVSDHGGRLSVGEAEGGGAEFRIVLPLAEERSRT